MLLDESLAIYLVKRRPRSELVKAKLDSYETVERESDVAGSTICDQVAPALFRQLVDLNSAKLLAMDASPSPELSQNKEQVDAKQRQDRTHHQDQYEPHNDRSLESRVSWSSCTDHSSSENGSTQLMALGDAVKLVSFSGFIVPSWLLISGPVKALQAIRLAWLEAKLTAPLGFKIKTIGHLRSVKVDQFGSLVRAFEKGELSLESGVIIKKDGKQQSQRQESTATKTIDGDSDDCEIGRITKQQQADNGNSSNSNNNKREQEREQAEQRDKRFRFLSKIISSSHPANNSNSRRKKSISHDSNKNEIDYVAKQQSDIEKKNNRKLDHHLSNSSKKIVGSGKIVDTESETTNSRAKQSEEVDNKAKMLIDQLKGTISLAVSQLEVQQQADSPGRGSHLSDILLYINNKRPDLLKNGEAVDIKLIDIVLDSMLAQGNLRSRSMKHSEVISLLEKNHHLHLRDSHEQHQQDRSTSFSSSGGPRSGQRTTTNNPNDDGVSLMSHFDDQEAAKWALNVSQSAYFSHIFYINNNKKTTITANINDSIPSKKQHHELGAADSTKASLQLEQIPQQAIKQQLTTNNNKAKSMTLDSGIGGGGGGGHGSWDMHSSSGSSGTNEECATNVSSRNSSRSSSYNSTTNGGRSRTRSLQVNSNKNLDYQVVNRNENKSPTRATISSPLALEIKSVHDKRDTKNNKEQAGERDLLEEEEETIWRASSSPSSSSYSRRRRIHPTARNDLPDRDADSRKKERQQQQATNHRDPTSSSATPTRTSASITSSSAASATTASHFVAANNNSQQIHDIANDRATNNHLFSLRRTLSFRPAQQVANSLGNSLGARHQLNNRPTTQLLQQTPTTQMETQTNEPKNDNNHHNQNSFALKWKWMNNNNNNDNDNTNNDLHVDATANATAMAPKLTAISQLLMRSKSLRAVSGVNKGRQAENNCNGNAGVSANARLMQMLPNDDTSTPTTTNMKMNMNINPNSKQLDCDTTKTGNYATRMMRVPDNNIVNKAPQASSTLLTNGGWSTLANDTATTTAANHYDYLTTAQVARSKRSSFSLRRRNSCSSDTAMHGRANAIDKLPCRNRELRTGNNHDISSNNNNNSTNTTTSNRTKIILFLRRLFSIRRTTNGVSSQKTTTSGSGNSDSSTNTSSPSNSSSVASINCCQQRHTTTMIGNHSSFRANLTSTTHHHHHHATTTAETTATQHQDDGSRSKVDARVYESLRNKQQQRSLLLKSPPNNTLGLLDTTGDCSDCSTGTNSLVEIIEASRRPLREERLRAQSLSRAAAWRTTPSGRGHQVEQLVVRSSSPNLMIPLGSLIANSSQQHHRSESSLSGASCSSARSSVSEQLRRHLDEAFKRHRRCTSRREKEFIDSINVLRQASRHALQAPTRPHSKSRQASKTPAGSTTCEHCDCQSHPLHNAANTSNQEHQEATVARICDCKDSQSQATMMKSQHPMLELDVDQEQEEFACRPSSPSFSTTSSYINSHYDQTSTATTKLDLIETSVTTNNNNIQEYIDVRQEEGKRSRRSHWIDEESMSHGPIGGEDLTALSLRSPEMKEIGTSALELSYDPNDDHHLRTHNHYEQHQNVHHHHEAPSHQMASINCSCCPYSLSTSENPANQHQHALNRCPFSSMGPAIACPVDGTSLGCGGASAGSSAGATISRPPPFMTNDLCCPLWRSMVYNYYQTCLMGSSALISAVPGPGTAGAQVLLPPPTLIPGELMHLPSELLTNPLQQQTASPTPQFNHHHLHHQKQSSNSTFNQQTSNQNHQHNTTIDLKIEIAGDFANKQQRGLKLAERQEEQRFSHNDTSDESPPQPVLSLCKKRPSTSLNLRNDTPVAIPIISVGQRTGGNNNNKFLSPSSRAAKNQAKSSRKSSTINKLPHGTTTVKVTPNSPLVSGENGEGISIISKTTTSKRLNSSIRGDNTANLTTKLNSSSDEIIKTQRNKKQRANSSEKQNSINETLEGDSLEEAEHDDDDDDDDESNECGEDDDSIERLMGSSVAIQRPQDNDQPNEQELNSRPIITSFHLKEPLDPIYNNNNHHDSGHFMDHHDHVASEPANTCPSPEEATTSQLMSCNSTYGRAGVMSFEQDSYCSSNDMNQRSEISPLRDE